MFERRLKIFLAVLVGFGALILLRSFQLQVLEGAHWQKEAADCMVRKQPLETVRGRILDVHGRPLAVDQPCMEAAVDYRAIVRNEKWMKERALARLRERGGEYRGQDKATRARMLDEELIRLSADLDALWAVLAAESGRPLHEIEETRTRIVNRVDARRRSIWYSNYKRAMGKRQASDEEEAWFKDWLLTRSAEPVLDSYRIEVAEETQAHTILREISPELHSRLKKQMSRFPGLEVRPGQRRCYPYASAACHVLGHLSLVSKKERDNDPDTLDERRGYQLDDLMGHSGVEASCEQVLRGTRGFILTDVSRGTVSRIEPVPGADVRLTIDIELQAAIEKAFASIRLEGEQDAHAMHGAAVVIDVPTGEVRALASYPTFNADQFDQLYPALRSDTLNQPLLNRAVRQTLPPGSTVKPIVGIGAAMQGLLHIDHVIECTGYLVINGRPMDYGRCWTAKMYEQLGPAFFMHHRLPTADPHRDGMLDLTDAIQRSCNVFFETLGDRMGLDGLSMVFDQFGLGRPTGIGMPGERAGLLPSSYKGNVTSIKWFSAIGQAQVLATPIQMANVAATIARGGVWVRPRLVSDEWQLNESVLSGRRGPDRVDLRIPSDILAAVKLGMERVVNTRAGSAYGAIRRPDISIAGKTGTAQASAYRHFVVDSEGRQVIDPQTGKPMVAWPRISTRTNPNPEARWYYAPEDDAGDLSHAWFIGYAPADNPQLAFAVVLEYGGKGGSATAPIVHAALDAAMNHRYLAPRNP